MGPHRETGRPFLFARTSGIFSGHANTEIKIWTFLLMIF